MNHGSFDRRAKNAFMRKALPFYSPGFKKKEINQVKTKINAMDERR